MGKPDGTAPDAARHSCTNCDSALPEGALFCSRCGQKTLYAPRSLREMAQSTFGRDFTPDGRLWLTLRALLVPGKLTRDWIEGRQQRYLGPMRLFLLAVFVHILATQLVLHSVPTVTEEARDPKLKTVFVIELGPTLGEPYALLSHHYANVFIDLHGGWLRSAFHPLASRAKANLEQMTETQFLRSASLRMVSMRSHAVAFMLPALIASLALAFVGCAQPVAKHTVFALHIAAFALLLEALVGMPMRYYESLTFSSYRAWTYTSVAQAGAAALWLWLALHRAYPSRPLGTLARGALVMAPLVLLWPYIDVFAALLALT